MGKPIYDGGAMKMDIEGTFKTMQEVSFGNS